jgi:hypothetical protein
MALIVAPVEIINHRFRGGLTGKKDHLDNDAARAAALGLSYGKYKALEREGRLPARALAAAEQPEEIDAPAPEYTIDPVTGTRRYIRKNYPAKPCEHCGKTFKPCAINGKYCCEECRVAADKIRIREAKKARRDKEKEAQA